MTHRVGICLDLMYHYRFQYSKDMRVQREKEPWNKNTQLRILGMQEEINGTNEKKYAYTLRTSNKEVF